jgi:hypothetical protein
MRRLVVTGIALALFTPALARGAGASAELTDEARSRIDAAIERAITAKRETQCRSALTNTALEGMSGKFTTDLRDAVYKGVTIATRGSR